MRGSVLKIFILGFTLLLGGSIFGQVKKKAELENKRSKLQKEIQLANSLLSETKSKEEATVGQLQTLSRKIKMREELIRTINREIQLLDQEIVSQQEQIKTLEIEIEDRKAEYVKMIQQAKRTQSEKNKLLFILSSSDFSQALRRMEYLQEIAEFRKQQVEEIKRKQLQLQEKVKELEASKNSKLALKEAKVGERSTLLSERQEQTQLAEVLNQKSAQIAADISKKQEESDRLEKEIQRIIALELKRARDAAERKGLENEAKQLGLVAGKDFTKRTNNAALRQLIARKRKENPAKDVAPAASYALTPEAKALAANFVSNKGKLPWPVERGIVVGKFGKQNHPISKGVIINKQHIEIACPSGTEARACFEGEVTSVIRIPGANKAVLIKHGNYFTVYSNLIEVNVKEGEKVSVKQSLGKIYTDKDEGQTVLHFGIWENTEPQDPQPWIYKN